MSEVKSCGKKDCKLYPIKKYPICKWWGNPKADVLIIGEPPSFQDNRLRAIFEDDQTFAKMQKYLGIAGINERNVFYASICRCQINKRDMPIQKDRDAVVQTCHSFALTAIAKIKPKLIITMGDYALQHIAGKKKITRDDVHGNIFWSDKFNCWICPVFGLSYIYRNEGKEEIVYRDFANIKVLVKSNYTKAEVIHEKPQKNYSELQSLAEYYKGKLSGPVALDTETQGLRWDNFPFICLGYSICVGEEAAHWITLFEETTVDKADFKIYWDRVVPGGITKQKIKTRIFVRMADNFERKIKELKQLMESPKAYKIFHHGSYDIHAMARAVELAGYLLKWPKDQWILKPQNVSWDTQFAAHVMDENIYKLVSLEKLQMYLITDEMPYNYNAAFGGMYDKSDMLAIQRDHKDDFIYYSCLTHKSIVYMADGSRKTIGHLVRNKSTEKVLSYNTETKKIEPKPIIGWIRKQHTTKEWYKIKYKCSGGNIFNKHNALNGPAFTPDHKILTNEGYVPITSLVPGKHKIATGDMALTPESIALILGCLLGDGSLVSRNNQGVGFSLTQSESRKSFFDMIHSIFPTAKVNKYKHKRKSMMLRFSSGYSKELTDLRDKLTFLPESNHLKLSVTDDILALLSPASLAAWYFSDGTFQPKTEHTRIYRTTLSGNTVEQQNIIAWLKSLGISAHYHDGGTINRYLHIDAVSRNNFFELIAPYASKDVLYKLPERYHHVPKKDMMLGASKSIYYADFEGVIKWDVPLKIRGYATSYCLDVLDNHNFLTDIGFVHNCADAESTWRIWRKQMQFFNNPENKKLLHYVNEFGPRSFSVLTELEKNGLLVDAEKVPAAIESVISQQADHVAAAIKAMPPKIKEQYADNLKLTRDCVVRDTMYSANGFNLPVKKRTGTTGEPSVDKDVRKLMLEELKGASFDFLMNYHEFEALNTIKTRYLKSLVEDRATDGRIHPNLSLCNTDTGRSSSSPNLQNLPKRGKHAASIRGLFVAPPGWEMLKADESQAELRWAAILSGDETMKDVFRADGDIHVTTGEQLAKRPWHTLTPEDREKYRQNAKPANFGLLYLMSPEGFQLYAKLDYGLDLTLDECKDIINTYFNTYSKLPLYHERTIAFGEKHGYVQTPLGRRRRLPELNSTDRGIRNQAQRKAVNVPIQGASSDLVVIAGSEILKMNLPASEIQMNMFIHDELIFYVKKGYAEKYAPIVKRAMEHPPLHKFGIKLDIPLRSDVSVGPNFYDCKEVKFDGYNFMGYKEDKK